MYQYRGASECWRYVEHAWIKDLLQKLALEVDATGQFRWRVWSGKKRVSPGWWRVDLVYATGEPVICPTSEDELKPCKFMIEVKR